MTERALENEVYDYKHYDKFVEPDENLNLGGATLKWYNIAKSGEPVPDEINALARQFLKKEFAIENPNGFGKFGFVILHRCGSDFYFLLVSTWRNGNELWESVYAKDSENQKDFRAVAFQDHHRATFCVWELAAVMHEKNSWRQFLISERTAADKSKFLSDKYRGTA